MGFFKKLLRLVAIVIAVVAIVLLIAAALVYALPALAAYVPFGLTATSLFGLGLLGLAVSAIASPEGFATVSKKVVSGGKKVATTVGNVAGSVLGSVTKGVLSAVPTAVWIALGGYFLLKRKGNTRDKAKETMIGGTNATTNGYDPRNQGYYNADPRYRLA
jgi:hypothetical protein